MNVKFIKILEIWILFVTHYSHLYVNALDLSWIPTDVNDASLPLSVKYRDSLRKLCDILKTSSKLPPELTDRRKVLSKMCKKLDFDDKASNSPGNLFNIFQNKRLLLTLGLIGTGGYFIWDNRQAIVIATKRWLKRNIIKVRRDHPKIVEDSYDQIRQARLKRFEASNRPEE